MPPTMIFLLDYDRSRGVVVSLRTFPAEERHTAEEERLRLELSLRRDGLEHEVVLLEATDEDALRKTHRRYFETLSELASPTPRNGDK